MSISAHPQSAVQQPPWLDPNKQTTDQSTTTATATEASTQHLRLYNSLTRKKERFATSDGSKRVSWYSCGPTVYDAAHMGHARAYVTFDIVRRVMEDYFGYRCLYVMNVTDIDDKIIERARQQYLLAEYRKRVVETSSTTAAVLTDVQASWSHYVSAKLLAKVERVPVPPALAKDPLRHWSDVQLFVEKNREIVDGDVGEKFPVIWATAVRVHQVVSHEATATNEVGAIVDACADVLMTSLDKEHGHTVTQHHIFQDLASHWEREFLNDMQALNVRPCDVLTRVSEYVPEIVGFVSKIMENGYAYEADGSVYFDVSAFKKKHDYAKLAPWSAGHTRLLAEGEGSLGTNLQGKRSPHDFALWKSSKPGEPAWESPWGNGRPGWHIECSAMAGDVIGETLDIHSGGIDLCFPHHDNELAQSEAYFGNQQWVNYFLHAGHLHIEGMKMSKSLKNFITIKDALAKYTASQLRIMFLRYSWESVLDYKESVLQEAVSIEQTVKNFCQTVKALRRQDTLAQAAAKAATNTTGALPKHNLHDAEKQLIASLDATQERVHRHLCDNINTPAVMLELMAVVSKANVYVRERPTGGNVDVLERVARYITKMFKLFGVIPTSDEDIGYPTSAQTANGGGSASTADTVLPYLDALATFRDDVRALARAKADPVEYLKLSDALRDTVLPALGVLLEDREGAKPMLKLASPEEIEAERQRKQQIDAARLQKKEEQARQMAEKKRERLERGRTPPSELWRGENASFSKFDEQGIPTHDAAGEELAKSRRKKLQKEWEAQEKLHRDFQQALQLGEVTSEKK